MAKEPTADSDAMLESERGKQGRVGSQRTTILRSDEDDPARAAFINALLEGLKKYAGETDD